MSSSYSCRSTSIVCLSYPLPGGSCLLQPLSRGPRVARMMGMGWPCGWSPHHNPLIYLSICLFVCLFATSFLYHHCFIFRESGFSTLPQVEQTQQYVPALCSSSQVWCEAAIWLHRGRLCFNWLFFLGLSYRDWLDFIGHPDMEPTHKAFRSLRTPWRGAMQGPTWHCSTIHHVSNLHSSGIMIC